MELNDGVVRKITQNVFNRLKGRVPRDWEEVYGGVVDGNAMASVRGLLYIATTKGGAGGAGGTGGKLWWRYPTGVIWKEINQGPFTNEISNMAGSGDILYCILGQNELCWRPAIDPKIGSWKITSGYGPEGAQGRRNAEHARQEIPDGPGGAGRHQVGVDGQGWPFP